MENFIGKLECSSAQPGLFTIIFSGPEIISLRKLMPEGYLDHSDALIQSKFENQSNICPANSENGQFDVLTAI